MRPLPPISAQIPEMSLADKLAQQPFWVIGLLLLGLTLCTLALTSSLRKRGRGQKGGVATTARDHLDHARSHVTPGPDTPPPRHRLDAVAVEVETLARRVGAQLDNRAARLEALIEEADAAANRLEAAQRATRALHQRPLPDLMAATAGASEPATPRTTVPPRLTHDVHALADAGHDAQAIARATEQPIGTVTLILALREAAASAAQQQQAESTEGQAASGTPPRS